MFVPPDDGRGLRQRPARPGRRTDPHPGADGQERQHQRAAG